MALTLDIAANTRAAQSQVKDLSKALDGVSDALDDVASEASGAGSKVERELDGMGNAGKEAARDIDGAGDKIERTFRDMVQDAKQADRAIDDIGSNGTKSFDQVRGGAQELRQEIGQNLGETVSSFRGDMSDLGQVGQDTLGGLAATVAGIGGAGGMIGALGLAGAAAAWGAFTQGQEDAKAKQEELNESAANFASGYLEGINGAISAAQVFAEINAIATDPERYQQAKEAAKEWGVSTEVAMGAMAGDTTALATAQQGLASRTAEAEAALAQQEKQVDSNSKAAYNLDDSVKAGTERMEGLTSALAQGKQQADDAAGALYNYATSAGEATGATDDLGNQIVRLPDGKEIVIDANTQRAYEDIDAIEKREVASKTVTINAIDNVTKMLNGLTNTRREINVDINYRKPGTTWY